MKIFLSVLIPVLALFTALMVPSLGTAEVYGGPVVTVRTSCGESTSYVAVVGISRRGKQLVLALSEGSAVRLAATGARRWKGAGKGRPSVFGGRQRTTFSVTAQGKRGFSIRTKTRVRFEGEVVCSFTELSQLVRQ